MRQIHGFKQVRRRTKFDPNPFIGSPQIPHLRGEWMQSRMNRHPGEIGIHCVVTFVVHKHMWTPFMGRIDMSQIDDGLDHPTLSTIVVILHHTATRWAMEDTG